MNSNSFQIINSNSFQLLNELIYQIKFYSEMHLCTHSCFNHFQTSQIENTKNCVDMCARDGRGAIEICLSEKGALAKKRLRNTYLK